MALKTQAHKQLEKRGGNLDFGSLPETPGAPKIHEKTYQKNDQKTVPSKNDICLQFVRFSGLPASIFIDFGIQNGCPDHYFLIIFWDRVFASMFDDFCRTNEKNEKLENSFRIVKHILS